MRKVDYRETLRTSLSLLSNMAALYEGYTLCGLVPAQNLTSPDFFGIRQERDDDHVLVTDSAKSVTLYKVSDQKPLCSWTVKQGQSLTCPVVYNSNTKEYISVSDHKVVRIWKEDDMTLDKAFKGTLSSDVWQVHSAQGAEPVALFRRGAVRLLDSVLAAPQQTVEDVLAHDEVLRWSTTVVADSEHCVIFTTEQKGDHFLYLQQLNSNRFQKYSLEREEPGLPPLSFSVAFRDKHICLLYLYPNGHVYQSVVPVRGVGGGDDGSQTHMLPRSLLLSLSVGEGFLEAAAALILDEAHVAVVGVPHPSAGASKDFLCIWNIHFQTLQAGKEMAGKIYGQLWSFSNKLLIPHGKSLSVIPYDCPKSCLASALGKMSQARTEECKGLSVPSWTNILHGEKVQPCRTADGRKTRTSRKTQSMMPNLSIEQIMDLIKTEPVEKVQQEMEAFIARSDTNDLQFIGRLASAIVSRSLADLSFYPGGVLSQLVQSRTLCHSICPDLVFLALEKRDYFLCQLCLQFFPDIPEAITCACLKTFISMADSDADMVDLEPSSVSFMDMLITKDDARVNSLNGCSPTSVKNDHLEIMDGDGIVTKEKKTQLEETCPVSLKRAVLINEILQTPYSENYLLPHLKDLTSHQAVVLLQYLHFLYLKYSQDAFPQRKALRSPTLNQVMDWVGLVLDAHFTVLVKTPEAKGLLLKLHNFVKLQVKLFSELGKIEGSLQEINKIKAKRDISQYSIEVLELF